MMIVGLLLVKYRLDSHKPKPSFISSHRQAS